MEAYRYKDIVQRNIAVGRVPSGTRLGWVIARFLITIAQQKPSILKKWREKKKTALCTVCTFYYVSTPEHFVC